MTSKTRITLIRNFVRVVMVLGVPVIMAYEPLKWFARAAWYCWLNEWRYYGRHVADAWRSDVAALRYYWSCPLQDESTGEWH